MKKIKILILILCLLGLEVGAFGETNAEPVTVGYSTGLISGDGFSLGIPLGASYLQFVAGGQFVTNSNWRSYSFGIDYKPMLVTFSLNPDVNCRLYGVIGGSFFTGNNTNWIGYGMLFAPLVTASLSELLLINELENSPPPDSPQVVAGLGFGFEMQIMKMFRLSVEPVVAGLEDVSATQFRGVRMGIQSSIQFDL